VSGGGTEEVGSAVVSLGLDTCDTTSQLNLMSAGATVDEVAERICLDPGDVLAVVRMSPPDVDDLWEEEGVLSRVGVHEVHGVLNPHCERTVPELWDG
jgi:hypothetical protein